MTGDGRSVPGGGAAAYRPRRSVLYMPSSNERALDKAKTMPVDALILDLEDAVAPDAKEAAREAACAAVRSGEYGRRELTIRVNGVGTQWHEADLRAACQAGPDGIVVPKVGSAKAVRSLVKAMEKHRAPAHTKLWAMVETPEAILGARKLAAASERLAVLVMGTNDLVKELDALHVPGREPVLPALAHTVLAARAAGVAIVDGVYNDVKDAEGFQAECRQGRAMGFDGKTLIHPGQVEPCNRIYAPSDEQVDHARGLIAAFEQALAERKGVATYQGKMIENLHVDTARKVLATREAIDALSAQ
ncbi:MAG: CoA ester lyase [Dermatophilaceae bacterium]